MLTPAQVKEYEFRASGRNAYRAEEVDDFVAVVGADYEKMFRENAELVKRVSMLADRLEQMKTDGDEIKSAVISAQRAAELIVKEAETSVQDSRDQAQAVLAAAKGEAEIIKEDAKKQAIADSELMLSLTRDKAEEIIKNAKAEAQSILLSAKSSASDKVGAATRTITSESILFDMLKKEVSDFKSSVLAQYKAHIEMISKLPDLAAEAAAKQQEAEAAEADEEKEAAEEPVAEAYAPEVAQTPTVSFIEEEEDEETAPLLFEEEPVVTTELPYDFFEQDTTLEYVCEPAEDEPETSPEQVQDAAPRGFTVDATVPDADTLSFEAPVFEQPADTDTFDEEAAASDEESPAQVSEASAEEPDDEEPAEEPADLPVSRAFRVDSESISLSDIESFEMPTDEDEEPEEKPRHGFFRRKNKE